MTKKASPVKIVLKEGPVIIRSLNGAGVNASHDLWEDVVASEYFPPNTDSAFYVLSLEKSVTQAAEVRLAETELVQALKLLAAAWPFSGGSFMVFETRTVAQAPRYDSNATAVETEFLAREGLQHVESSHTINYEVLATYLQPPLTTAVRLAKAMRKEPFLERLLGYYHQAKMGYYYRQKYDRSSWFVDLYKIQDILKEIYGKKKVKCSLKFQEGDWSFFETTLNTNDLRHANTKRVAPAVAVRDVDRLYELARCWIEKHLVERGLLGGSI